MARAEMILRTQSTLTELRGKFSLTLGGPQEETFLEKAKRLGLLRDVLSKTIIPCQVELKGEGRINPCLIVPNSYPVEMFPPHKRLAAGGQVESLANSEYTLPRLIVEGGVAASRHMARRTDADIGLDPRKLQIPREAQLVILPVRLVYRTRPRCRVASPAGRTRPQARAL